VTVAPVEPSAPSAGGGTQPPLSPRSQSDSRERRYQAAATVEEAIGLRASLVGVFGAKPFNNFWYRKT